MQQKASQSDGVGASVPVIAILASVVAVLVLTAGALLYCEVSSDEQHRRIVIATGPASGTYHALGQAMKRVLESTGMFSEVVIRSTDGSVENMQLIREAEPDVDFAFVQGDASPSTNARLVANLYEELLHVMISKSDAQDIRTIYDLAGKRVSLGAAGSGTRELSLRVLAHFGVDVAEDLVMTPGEAAAALTDETIDAAFLLTAVPSRLVFNLAQRDSIRFITLGEAMPEGGEAHALELVFPGVVRATIPRSTYVRLPQRAVRTVSVSAQLVAREALEEGLVRDVTAIIFGYRSGESGLEGNELAVARKIREDYNPSRVIIPYHPGATGYYRREEPPFFVEYAEALSLGLTAMLGLYSGFIALREWVRRRMKNRIDAYLVQVQKITTGCESLPKEQLLERHGQLEALRRAAFGDLVAERLLADEAFIILQNHLRDELEVIAGLMGAAVEQR